MAALVAGMMAHDTAAVPALCTALAGVLMRKGWMMATAESCTGGLIAGACTDLSGSSQWFERGFVTYSNQAKTDLLGVDPGVLQQEGAVSEAVARAMVQGTLRHAPVQVAVAVTGVAGPTGGSAAKPVGTVWFGWNVDGQVSSAMRHFPGDRAEVRAATVQHALAQLLALVEPPPVSPGHGDG
jgi:nicotinamide-nucleotide amidase